MGCLSDLLLAYCGATRGLRWYATGHRFGAHRVWWQFNSITNADSVVHQPRMQVSSMSIPSRRHADQNSDTVAQMHISNLVPLIQVQAIELNLELTVRIA